MTTILTEFLIILLLVLFNGLLAMSEISIVSSRKPRLMHRAAEGDAGARVALELASEPNQFLSTVQIGITLVGILAGAFGGATIAEELSARISEVPALARYSKAIGLGAVVLMVSYLSLILGELVPKRVGLNNAEGIACLVARPMRVFSAITSPAVRVLSFSTDIALRILRVRPRSEPPVTEEEIKVMIDQGAKAGVFDTAEQEMLLNVFRLGDRRVSALMTPRREIVWFDIEDSPEVILAEMTAHPHTRFIVCEGNLDNVVGIVRAKDLLVQSLNGRPMELSSAIRRSLFIPESTRALNALELFKQTGSHIAVVVDEHGGTQGLVTHHDIMEAIVGDIPSSDMPEDAVAIKRDDGSWLCDGSLGIDEFKRMLKLTKLPKEESGSYETLAGLILARMGRIPATGERFVWQGISFEILDMDRHRIDKVLVKAVGEKNNR